MPVMSPGADVPGPACRRWASEPPSAPDSSPGDEQAGYVAGLAAVRAEKEALVQQNGQTWQLLEERTNELHRLQAGPESMLLLLLVPPGHVLAAHNAQHGVQCLHAAGAACAPAESRTWVE